MLVKTEFVVAQITEQMRAIVLHLTTLSCWFEVDPQPDDQYFIEVKKDVGASAFPTDMNRFPHERRLE